MTAPGSSSRTLGRRTIGAGGDAIRSFLFYLLILPLLIMIVLGTLRFGFAVRFWRRLYVVGLVYVALLLLRVVAQIVW